MIRWTRTRTLYRLLRDGNEQGGGSWRGDFKTAKIMENGNMAQVWGDHSRVGMTFITTPATNVVELIGGIWLQMKNNGSQCFRLALSA